MGQIKRAGIKEAADQGQHHTEQPEFKMTGKVDQNADPYGLSNQENIASITTNVERNPQMVQNAKDIELTKNIVKAKQALMTVQVLSKSTGLVLFIKRLLILPYQNFESIPSNESSHSKLVPKELFLSSSQDSVHHEPD
ncbi:hypothetical protein Tco_0195006 [Tanacetum coccineum]